MDGKSYRVVNIPEKGQCLVASRDLDPLAIILMDQAALVAPHHGGGETVCLGCMGQVIEGEESECPGCGAVLCSEECQGDWHSREECSLLARVEGLGGLGGQHLQVFAALRLLLLKEEQHKVWHQIDQLMDHEDTRRNNKQEWSMFQKEVVDIIKKLRPDVEEDLVHRLIGIIGINSISFSFKKSHRRGRALYPVLSLVSHSCVSNARYTVNPEDFSVVLRARRKIEEGEEITIQYVPPCYGVPKRKLEIESEWFFKCRCARCSDVTEFGTYASALKCYSCREGLVLPEEPQEDSLWRCRFCSNPFEAEFIRELVCNIEDELELVMRSNSSTVNGLETFIKTHTKDLHVKHYLNLIAQRRMVQLLSQDPAVTRNKAKKTLRLCKTLQTTMSRLDPGLSEWSGFIARTMNKARLELLKLDFQEKKLGKNDFIEESELVWGEMKEVDKCEVLCTPVKYREQA